MHIFGTENIVINFLKQNYYIAILLMIVICEVLYYRLFDINETGLSFKMFSLIFATLITGILIGLAALFVDVIAFLHEKNMLLKVFFWITGILLFIIVNIYIKRKMRGKNYD